jgi:hypothetical protein
MAQMIKANKRIVLDAEAETELESTLVEMEAEKAAFEGLSRFVTNSVRESMSMDGLLGMRCNGPSRESCRRSKSSSIKGQPAASSFPRRV